MWVRRALGASCNHFVLLLTEHYLYSSSVFLCTHREIEGGESKGKEKEGCNQRIDDVVVEGIGSVRNIYI